MSDSCWVCGIKFIPHGPSFKEEHHVFPRNAGGTDGPLVCLCPNHHTAAHQLAIRIQKNKNPEELLVHEPQDRIKKIAYLAKAIVKAEALVANDPNKGVTFTMKLGPNELRALEVLKKKYPKKSRSDIVRAAIFVFATTSQRK